MDILLWIVLGALAGWIAEMIMKSNHGLLENIFFGIFGAILGGFIMKSMGLSGVTGFNFYSLVVAIIGAALLILIGRKLRE